MAGLAGTGDGVEPPLLLAGLRIVGGDEAADAVLAAGHADDHLVLDDERRQRQRVAGAGVGDAGLPDGPAADRVDRDELGVDGAHEQRVAQNRHAAVDAPAAGARLGRRGVLVAPEDAAELRVEGQHGVGRLGDVHDAVHHERRRLEDLQRLRLEDPLQLEAVDVVDGNLVEGRVAVAVVVARVGEPVVRLVGGVEQPLEGHLRGQRVRQQGHEGDGGEDQGGARRPGHRFIPFKVRRNASTSARSCSVSVSAYEGIGDVVITVYSLRSSLTSETSRSLSSMSCTV